VTAVIAQAEQLAVAVVAICDAFERGEWSRVRAALAGKGLAPLFDLFELGAENGTETKRLVSPTPHGRSFG
jgi:hypothetical protein